MSRFLPLIIFVIWLSSPPAHVAGGLDPALACVIFLGFHVVLIAILSLWSQRVARLAHLSQIQRRLRRFNTVIYASRILIPAWLAVGVFALGWKEMVLAALARTPVGRMPIDCPGLILGCLPSFITWMGLWWAQFPADRALREQNILIQLNENLPLQPPPSFRTYFFVNLRLQLLFTIAPASLLLVLHDVLALILPPIFRHIPAMENRQELAEAMVTLPAFAFFLVFSPEILRRVLQTERMPDCPLRRKLAKIAERHHVGFHDVLLWKTQFQMGNAAVMGFIPRFRYVLLSDLLLETMRDEQIEAIFAHEAGHVVHRHLFWLIAAMAAMLFAMAGPGQMVADGLESLQGHVWMAESVQMALLLGAGMAMFGLVFGYVSRKFERQADVFAARAIQSAFESETDHTGPAADLLNAQNSSPGLEIQIATPALSNAAVLDPPPITPPATGRGYVGRHGAAVFCSALERVAAVNNIPIAARSWCHGSIAKRMRFLENLSREERRTAEFDRFMSRLYVVLILCLCAFAVWTMLTFKA